MLSSKKVPLEFTNKPSKYKKYHKIKFEKAIKYCDRNSGHSFVSQEIKFMPAKQVLSVLKIVKPSLKKVSALSLRRKRAKMRLITWPTVMLTKKPKDIRMGRGKGMPTERVALAGISPIFSIHRANSFLLKKVLNTCAPKIHGGKYLRLQK